MDATRKRLSFLRKDWDESAHARDEHGRFGSSTGAQLHAALQYHAARASNPKAQPTDHGVGWGDLENHERHLVRAGLLDQPVKENGGLGQATITDAGRRLAAGPPGDVAAAMRAIPGATADNPITGPTAGAPNGAYVARERRDHAPVAASPVHLNLVDTPQALRPCFGDKMPDKASLERVWSHDATGTSVVLQDVGGYGDVHANGKEVNVHGQVVRGGRVIGEVSRTFKRGLDGSLTVEHDLFKIDKADDQRGGMGAAMLAQSIQAYKAMGVDAVTTHPAWSGPYVWASLGFDDPSAKGKVSGVDRCRAALPPYLNRVHGIPLDRAVQVANSLNHLHQFADLDLTKDGEFAGRDRPGMVVHHVSAERRADGSNAEMDVHVGAHFLLTTRNWTQGAIDLKDKSSASYQRAHARLGVAP